jgi:hypothetical protein
MNSYIPEDLFLVLLKRLDILLFFQLQILKTGEEAWVGDFTAWFGA